MGPIRTLLIFAVTLSAALMVPAAAHADTEFMMGGKGLSKAETETFEGTFSFTSSAGGISCPTKVELTFESGSTGKVKSFVIPDPGKCTYSGNLDNLCGTVDVQGATNPPWTIHAVASGGYTVQLTTGHIDTGGTGIFCPDVTVSGTVIATPDKAGEISSITMSGTLGSNLGTSATAGGTLSAGHAKTYGIGNGPSKKNWTHNWSSLASKASTLLHGSFSWTSTWGGVTCDVSSEMHLEPGSTGTVTSFAPLDTSACELTGSVSQCGSDAIASHLSLGLPWTVHATKRENGEYGILITNVSSSVNFVGASCPDVLILSDIWMAADPHDLGEATLSGENPAGFPPSINGSVEVTPNGTYGIET